MRSRSIANCRYSVFLDGTTVTFRANEPFVGQIAALYILEESSRADVIADLQLLQDRVWLAPVLPDRSVGAKVEQPLNYGSLKSTQHVDFGHIWYQQRAFIAELPPGEYVSTHVQSYPGLPDFTATMHIIITP